LRIAKRNLEVGHTLGWKGYKRNYFSNPRTRERAGITDLNTNLVFLGKNWVTPTGARLSWYLAGGSSPPEELWAKTLEREGRNLDDYSA
jgi:hypothetical protein